MLVMYVLFFVFFQFFALLRMTIAECYTTAIATIFIVAVTNLIFHM